jgi:hypothetical protein
MVGCRKNDKLEGIEKDLKEPVEGQLDAVPEYASKE